MAAFVAIAGKTIDDATSITHSASTGSGNLLLAICGSKDSMTHSLSVSDSNWEEVVKTNTAYPGYQAIGVWKLKSLTTGASESLTVTSSTASNVLTMHLLEISSANGVSDYSTYAYSQISGISYFVLESVTTSAANCLVVGSVFVSGDNPFVPSGYAQRMETLNEETPDVFLNTGTKEYASAGATGDAIGSLNGTEATSYLSVHLALSYGGGAGGGTAYGDIFRDHAF